MAAGLRKAYRRPVYVGGNSTAESGVILLDSATPNFSLRGPWEPMGSDSTRSVTDSMRVVDRRPARRRLESLDGDLLERRRQQPLNVAEQARLRRRHE